MFGNVQIRLSLLLFLKQRAGELLVRNQVCVSWRPSFGPLIIVLTPSVRLFSYFSRSLLEAMYEILIVEIESKYRQEASVHPTATLTISV